MLFWFAASQQAPKDYVYNMRLILIYTEHMIQMIYRVFAVQHGLDYQKLAAYQASDPDIQSYRTAVTNLRLEDVPFMDGSFTVLCDVSTGYWPFPCYGGASRLGC